MKVEKVLDLRYGDLINSNLKNQDLSFAQMQNVDFQIYHFQTSEMLTSVMQIFKTSTYHIQF